MFMIQSAVRSFAGVSPAVRLAALLAIQLATVSIAYNQVFDFECRAVASPLFCGFLSASVLRAMTLGAVTAVVILARREAAGALQGAVRPRLDPRWLALQGAGFVAVMAPMTFLSDATAAALFPAAVLLWLAGAAAAVVGAGCALAPGRAWLALVRAGGAPLAAAFAVGALAPELADRAQRLWQIDTVTDATFNSVALLLRAVGESVVSVPERHELGVVEFAVLVGRQCSGVEGFALITGFLSLYIVMFRDRLRLPHALVLLPVGLALSWILNVVRIALLILIGAYVSPDLAVNGFHSHAGWLMFTMLSMGVVIAAQATPWLAKDAAGAAAAPVSMAAPPLSQDWNAAQLVPFIVFMLTALVASTFFATPGLYYPARVVATAAALLAFRSLYMTLPWRPDAVALGSGLLIGVLWVATDPPVADADSALALALSDLPLWLFLLWALCRVVGTAVLAPLVEEFAFRGYLLKRLDFGGPLGAAAALVVSTALFALLHDRWLAAALAGVVFALLVWRRGRIADAIWSHAAANGAIAGYAVATGQWSVI